MFKNTIEIINKLKKDTNNILDITYRDMTISNNKLTIIFNEPLTSSDKISDFIIKSLNNIKAKNIYNEIVNNIYNFKCIEIKTYQEMCNYLNQGYTIILIENEKNALALETKGNLGRSINIPDTEATLRGAKDAFVEDIQRNIGLIRKRIKNNNLRIDNLKLGKYTNTQIDIVYLNDVCPKELINQIKEKISRIETNGLINSEQLKNLLDKKNFFPLPTIMTTERPDLASNAIINGKVVIIVDNSPYALIIPGLLNDYFKTSEDFYSKNINVTITRILRYIAFFIAIMTPAIYLTLITYNQEIIPTKLLVNFATQRDGVPFPAFFEAFIMIVAFELLRESDIRVSAFTGSALSIVGALILGDAAVSAGIVSPIMIIVIATTAISSLPFNEPDLINALRWYRILFMIGASLLGIIGFLIVLIYLIIELVSTKSFDIPYLIPYAPFSKKGLKDSFIKTNNRNDNLVKDYLKGEQYEKN